MPQPCDIGRRTGRSDGEIRLSHDERWHALAARGYSSTWPRSGPATLFTVPDIVEHQHAITLAHLAGRCRTGAASGTGVWPAITAVNQDIAAIGHELVASLLARMRSSDAAGPQRTIIPAELVIRSSTAPPKRG